MIAPSGKTSWSGGSLFSGNGSWAASKPDVKRRRADSTCANQNDTRLEHKLRILKKNQVVCWCPKSETLLSVLLDLYLFITTICRNQQHYLPHQHHPDQEDHPVLVTGLPELGPEWSVVVCWAELWSRVRSWCLVLLLIPGCLPTHAKTPRQQLFPQET